MRRKWFFWAVIAVSLFAPLAAALRPQDDFSAPPATCVLELWHTDSFEGGKNSRAGYLKARAAEFQRIHSGVFVLVRQVSEEELINRLGEGQMPDMFSFSAGVGERLLPYLEEYGGGNFRQTLRASATHGGRQYALPWCMGGYAFFCYAGRLTKAGVTAEQFAKNPLQPALASKSGGLLGYGRAQYNNPAAALKAFALPDGNANAGTQNYTQAEAYAAYATGRVSVLLGTQRDLVRMENALLSGRADGFHMVPVSGYTDLVTYFGLAKGADARVAEAFFEYVLSPRAQQALSGIGMFSVTGEGVYTQGGHAAIERALGGSLTVPNVFTSAEELNRARTN